MSNDVLLEIGLEELPARFIDNAMEQLVEHCEHWLHENRLKFDKIIPYSTPRRLAIIVENIADSQETLSEEVRGPSKQIAQNEDGTWTKAAIRSEEHTSELQSRGHLVCRLLLEK